MQLMFDNFIAADAMNSGGGGAFSVISMIGVFVIVNIVVIFVVFVVIFVGTVTVVMAAILSARSFRYFSHLGQSKAVIFFPSAASKLVTLPPPHCGLKQHEIDEWSTSASHCSFIRLLRTARSALLAALTRSIASSLARS